MEWLPFDILELIGKKLHKLYMEDLEEELYEACWERENNLGHDFDDWDSDYYPSTEGDSD